MRTLRRVTPLHTSAPAHPTQRFAGTKRRRLKATRDGRPPSRPQRYDGARSLFVKYYKQELLAALPPQLSDTKCVRQMLKLHWDGAPLQIKQVRAEWRAEGRATPAHPRHLVRSRSHARPARQQFFMLEATEKARWERDVQEYEAMYPEAPPTPAASVASAATSNASPVPMSMSMSAAVVAAPGTSRTRMPWQSPGTIVRGLTQG